MKNNSQKLSTEPYRGTRDFYPEDMGVQNYIFSTMRKVVEQYGYVEYGASILEETAIYRAKTGSEIVNEQTYSFIDRGNRDVTIRPEMTPTIARMIAHKRKGLSFPLRWYSIPNLFRYERPQRGRLREHWQLNVDLFGIDNVEADAEIISVAYDVMRTFGAKDENFIIRLNSRKLINYLVNDYFGLEKESGYQLTKLIDKKEKIEAKEFILQAEKFLGDRTNKLIKFLDCKKISEIPKEFSENIGVKELQTLQKLLLEKKIKNYIFDPSLIRGFDYYTGTVFEVFDTNPINNRSLFGGGRYDDLVAIFGAEKVPGVGFGMGDVTIRDYIETYDLLPKYQSTTKLYICRLKEEFDQFTDELVGYLRKQGINVAVDYTNRKIPAQIKTAEKQSIPFIICIGDEEVKTKMFKLKNLAMRNEKIVDREALVDFIQKEK
ncbi:MAG: histidine--tRNA ligase [Candidatus Komeilibacteria bacterium]